MRSLCFCIILVIAGVNISAQTAKRQTVATPLSELEVRRHILLSGEYLLSQIQPDGRFIYHQHLDPRVKYTNSAYNELRHAGTLFALGEYYKSLPAASIKNKVFLSAEYLINDYVKPLPGYSGVYAVVSKPKKLPPDNMPVAKLGGTGLTLMALVPLYQIDKRIISLEKLQGLGKFLIFMQKPNGSAHSKYYLNTKKFSKWTSLYYPGEAAIGLLYLYDVDKDKKWFRFAKQYLLYLARSRAGKKNVAIDHWALLATHKIFESNKALLNKNEISLLKNHAIQIINEILILQNMNKQDNSYGAFVGSMTSPVATRMEAMIAGYEIVTDSALKKRIVKSISAGMTFLLNAQLKDGIYKGGTPRALYRLPDDPKNNSFNDRVGEIRIDYVQHSLCAMIEYLKLLNK